MLFVTMANPSPFARKSSLSKWASGSPEDDLQFEPGRPKFARHADEKARRAVDEASTYDIPEKKKREALAKYKVGTKVKASGYAGVVKIGSVGKVLEVLERTSSGAIRYKVDFGSEGVATVLEQSLQRYG